MVEMDQGTDLESRLLTLAPEDLLKYSLSWRRVLEVPVRPGVTPEQNNAERDPQGEPN